MKSGREIVIFCLILSVLSIFVKGYNYGVGNQVDQIPLVMRELDKSYLVRDYITTVDSEFGPRYFFVILMAAFARFMPLPLVYLIFTVLANFLVALVSFVFAGRLFKSRLAGGLAVVLVLSLDSIQIGGASELSSPVLVPQPLAMPLALYSLWLGYQGKLRNCAFIAGLASLIHPLVGLEVGILSLLAAAIQLGVKRVLVPFLILGLFGIMWAVPQLGQLKMPDSEFIQNLAYFRAPHHYLPSSWSSRFYIDLGIFLATILVCWKYLKLKKDWYLPLVVLLTLGFFLLGYLLVEIWPTRLLTILQPFRLAFLVKFIGFLYMAGFLARVIQIKDKGTIWLKIGLGLLFITVFGTAQPKNLLVLVILSSFLGAAILFKKNSSPILSILGIFLIVILLQTDRFKPSFTLAGLKSDSLPVAKYAKENSPEEAIFWTPPDFGEFRLTAQRAIIADFKVDPYSDLARREWKQRLMDSYGGNSLSDFEANSKKIEDTRLDSLKSKYGISYAILYLENPTQKKVIYQDQTYKIVELR